MLEQDLVSLSNYLAALKARYERELQGMPEGKLLVTNGKDGKRYYASMWKDGKRVRRGIKRNPDLICSYARKELLERSIAALGHNHAVLCAALKDLRQCDPYELIAEMSATYERVPVECYFNPMKDHELMRLFASDEHKIQSHEPWGNKCEAPSRFKEEDLAFVTAKGLRVRSKAEVLIAEKLDSYGIQYRYEKELSVGDAVFHPDFTFEGNGGKLFFLEYCGMMNDEKYLSGFRWKREKYESAGINEWTNIIYIYATKNEINMMYIDYLIRTRIIPWL